jgi:hypothetical protein
MIRATTARARGIPLAVRRARRPAQENTYLRN